MATDFARNFSLLNIFVRQETITAASQRFELGNRDSEDVMVINQSQRAVRCRTGDVNVVADEFAVPILPGEKTVYARGPRGGRATHIAFVVATGQAKIKFTTGSGV